VTTGSESHDSCDSGSPVQIGPWVKARLQEEPKVAIQFSPVIAVPTQGDGYPFISHRVNVGKLGRLASPILMCDEGHVRGRPFSPHPHAGFSAVSYLFEDSQDELRTRDSLGNDVVTGPGGMVWTQAGSGVVHEEMAAQPDGDMHMVQMFVNLPRDGKLAPPRVFHLEPSEVPEWRGGAGDQVRVPVGSFDGKSSPLTPAQRFRFLDVWLRSEISFGLQDGHNALIYVMSGAVAVRAEGGERRLEAAHAVAMGGDGASVTLTASEAAHVLVVSGAEIREPVVTSGPFIMNDRAQVDDAVARYRAGRMGQLAPGE
jgi:redox-sensitive bicupin YhaK (pirin superfamily)